MSEASAGIAFCFSFPFLFLVRSFVRSFLPSSAVPGGAMRARGQVSLPHHRPPHRARYTTMHEDNPILKLSLARSLGPTKEGGIKGMQSGGGGGGGGGNWRRRKRRPREKQHRVFFASLSFFLSISAKPDLEPGAAARSTAATAAWVVFSHFCVVSRSVGRPSSVGARGGAARR